MTAQQQQAIEDAKEWIVYYRRSDTLPGYNNHIMAVLNRAHEVFMGSLINWTCGACIKSAMQTLTARYDDYVSYKAMQAEEETKVEYKHNSEGTRKHGKKR